jgi:hypothetical protein
MAAFIQPQNGVEQSNTNDASRWLQSLAQFLGIEYGELFRLDPVYDPLDIQWLE